MRAGDPRGGRRPRSPTGCSSSATRTRRSPAREAAGDDAARARRGGAAELRPVDARGAQPDRGRPALAAALLPGRALGASSSRARASPGERLVVGDVMADAHRLFAPIARGALARRSSGSGSSRAGTSSSRCTGRRTCEPERLARIVEGLNRLEEPIVFPAHPRTRAALERARAARLRADPDPLGYLDFAALAVAGARDRHRLRRRAEGGLLVRRALRHACGRPPSGSTPSRPARTCSSTTTPTRSSRAVADRALPGRRAAALRRRAGERPHRSRSVRFSP